MTMFSILVAVSLSFSGLPATVTPQLTESGDWTIVTVDSDGYFAGSLSLALDSLGYPHIAYHDSVNRTLNYARWTGYNWNTEIVDPTYGLAHSSMVLDSNDHPHISYSYSKNETLKYAKWNGTGWSIENVTEASSGLSSLTLDTNDSPHVSFRDVLNQTLKYAKWNGIEWNIQFVDSSCRVGNTHSLALDSNDLPHFSYHARGYYDLRYANWNGTDWNVTTVDSEGNVGLANSIALDGKDNPHISYGYTSGSGGQVLKYASWNGTAWNNMTVDSGSNVGKASLALDSEDNPHLGYSGLHVLGFHEGLKYAKWNGTAWNKEIVDSESNIGGPPSIALDTSEKPHIAYIDAYKADLKYATKANLTPPSRSVSLDIDPDTLNLKSRGRWITAYLTSEDANVKDIDVSSLLLNDVVSPARWDIQNDETVLMVKFDRADVQAILPISEAVDIKVTGQWMDGESFEVHDTIRVILPGRVPLAPKSTPPGIEFRSNLEVTTDEVRYFQLDAIYSFTYRERFMNQQPQRTSLGKGLI